MLLLLVMISIGLVSADTSTRDKRSTDNLEYVIRVLEEQGRLDEVDPKLLERIQATVQKTKTRGGKLSDSGINLSKTTPRTSVLEFGHRAVPLLHHFKVSQDLRSLTETVCLAESARLSRLRTVFLSSSCLLPSHSLRKQPELRIF